MDVFSTGRMRSISTAGPYAHHRCGSSETRTRCLCLRLGSALDRSIGDTGHELGRHLEGHLDRVALAAVDVNHGQRAVEHPLFAAARRARQRESDAVGKLIPAPRAHFEAFFVEDPVGPLVTHNPARSSQEGPEPAVPKARSRRRRLMRWLGADDSHGLWYRFRGQVRAVRRTPSMGRS